MKSYPTWEQVSDDLGDKVLRAVSVAVARARADFTLYRRTFPGWVAQATERGLASWLHDRLFFHLVAELDGIPQVSIVDREPIRDIYVGLHYRVRVKRHHEDGRISGYPTDGMLEFVFQPEQGTLFDQWNLAVGYKWLGDAREVGPAVISLRDGDDIKWMHNLPETDLGDAGGTSVTLPPAPEPKLPTIQTSRPETAADIEARE